MSATSLSAHIRAAIVGTAICTMMLTALAGWGIVQYLLRSTAHERATALASILASNSAAVLSLRDQVRARELLTSAASSHQLVSARFMDSNGEVLAVFQRPGSSHSAGSTDSSLASVTNLVVYGGETLGAVEVKVDNALVASIPALFLLACAAVASTLLVVVWLAAKPIEKIISKPLQSLSIFTRRIRDTRDYSLRVPASPVAEMRGLIDDFNAMIGVIEKSSAEQTDRSSQLSKLAFYDQLTGAANRSLFRDRLGRCVSEHRKSQIEFAIIGIDLDHFKQLNDSMGHNAGDEFLREASARCIRALRPNDTFARMGGDEFVALLPGVGSISAALAIAEKLRAAVKDANEVHASDIRCTASIGVGLFPIDANTASDLMAQVDAAMYRAKAAGRDCVISVSDPNDEAINRPQPKPHRIYA